MSILVGNILAFIGSVMTVIAGYIKTKKKALFMEIVYNSLSVVACVFLEAYTGAVVNLISVPRAVLAYKDKMNWPIKIVMLSVASTLSLLLNKNGWLGLLPVVSTVSYTLLVDKMQGRAFKLLGIWTMILWLGYDITTHNYASAAFDIGFTITATIAIIRITRDKKRQMERSSSPGGKQDENCKCYPEGTTQER